MLNQVVLVGRLVRTPELQVTENGKKMAYITLAVNRTFKNQNGEYDTDFIDCTLWTGIAENTAEYCKAGDIIGVKGRIQTRLIDNDDGTKHKRVEVVAEKITFLASSRKKEEQNNNDDKTLEEDIIDVDMIKEPEKKYKKSKTKE